MLLFPALPEAHKLMVKSPSIPCVIRSSPVSNPQPFEVIQPPESLVGDRAGSVWSGGVSSETGGVGASSPEDGGVGCAVTGGFGSPEEELPPPPHATSRKIMAADSIARNKYIEDSTGIQKIYAYCFDIVNSIWARISVIPYCVRPQFDPAQGLDQRDDSRRPPRRQGLGLRQNRLHRRIL